MSAAKALQIRGLTGLTESDDTCAAPSHATHAFHASQPTHIPIEMVATVPVSKLNSEWQPDYGDEVHEVDDAGNKEATYDDGEENVTGFVEFHTEKDTSGNEMQG